MRIRIHYLLFCTTIFLSACKISKKKDDGPVKPQSDFTTISYTESIQYVIDMVGYSQTTYSSDETPVLGQISGQFLVNGDASASVLPWAAPTVGTCVLQQNDLPNLFIIRRFDAGDFFVNEGQNSNQISKREDRIYFNSVFFPPASYNVASSGHNNTLIINQPMNVVAPALEIAIENGAGRGVAKIHSLSDGIPTSLNLTKSEDLVLFTRFNDDLLMEEDPIIESSNRTDSHFIRVTVGGNGGNAINCYATPDANAIVISKGWLANIVQGDATYIKVDLVWQDLNFDTPTLKESLVRSMTSHIYGNYLGAQFLGVIDLAN